MNALPKRQLVMLGLILSLIPLLSNSAVVLAEFVENFGHIGTMRDLTGCFG
jgi:hypothetical protein